MGWHSLCVHFLLCFLNGTGNNSMIRGNLCHNLISLLYAYYIYSLYLPLIYFEFQNIFFNPWCTKIAVDKINVCKIKKKYIRQAISYWHRDANHSNFCGVIPIFKSVLRIMFSEIKIPASKDLKMLQDKIKEVAPPCTPLFTGSEIGLFPFKKKTDWFVCHLLKRHKYSV